MATTTDQQAAFPGKHDAFLCEAVMLFAKGLFNTKFVIEPNGMVEVLDDEEIASDLNVNTLPAKAGGFGLRLKAGSIGTSADDRHTTVKSSSASRSYRAPYWTH